MKTFDRLAAAAPMLLLLAPLLLASCGSPGRTPDGGGPVEPVFVVPGDPVLDPRALAVVDRPLEILANRIEIHLPASLYGKDALPVELRVGHHTQVEFGTELGRRISLQPPPAPTGALPVPARMSLGNWRLASFGPLEVLWAYGGPREGVWLEATGVALCSRDGTIRREISSVVVVGDELRIGSNP